MNQEQQLRNDEVIKIMADVNNFQSTGNKEMDMAILDTKPLIYQFIKYSQVFIAYLENFTSKHQDEYINTILINLPFQVSMTLLDYRTNGDTKEMEELTQWFKEQLTSLTK
jgi:hypothetical protein